MKQCVLITLVLLLIAASAVPAQAIGGFDGIYLMTATPATPGSEAVTLHVTVSQNGSALILVNLNSDGTWTVGFATMIGSSASGLYRDHEGVVFGTFALIFFGNGSFAGSAVINATAYSLSGVKVF